MPVKPDKLADSTEKLSKAMEKLSDTTKTVSTVLGTGALLGIFKKITSAIPESTNKVISQLVKQTANLTTSMDRGVQRLRSGFQSLYDAMRAGVISLNSLFATAQVHRLAPGHHQSSASEVLGNIFSKVFTDAPQSPTYGTTGSSFSASTSRGSQLPIPSDQRTSGGGRQSAEIVSKLTQINTAIINSSNITSVAITDLKSATANSIDKVVKAIAASGREVEHTSADGTTIISSDIRLLTDVSRGILEKLDSIRLMIRESVNVFGKLSQVYNKQVGILGNIAGDLGKMLVGIAQLIAEQTRIAAPIKITPEALKRIAHIEQGVLNVLARSVGSRSSVYVHVNDDPASRAGVTRDKKSSSGLGIGAIAGVGGFVGGLIGGALGAFGAALNPGAAEQLGLAFRDLSATIGVAFEPAMRVVTAGFRQVAAAVLPLFVKLQPIFTQFVDLFTRLLVPIIRIVAKLFEVLEAPLKIIVSMLDGFVDVITYLSSVVVAFVDMLREFVSNITASDFGHQMNELIDNIRWVGQQLVLAIALIAKKLGATHFVDKLITAFDEATHPKQGGAVAGAAASVTSLESIVKKMAESAGLAGAFGGKTKEDEAREREEQRIEMARKTLEALQEIQKKGDTERLFKDLMSVVSSIKTGIGAVDESIKLVIDLFRVIGRKFNLTTSETDFLQGYQSRLAKGLPQ